MVRNRAECKHRVWSPLTAALVLITGAAAQTGAEPPWAQSLGYRPAEIFSIRVGKFGYPYISASVNGHAVELAIDTANMTGLSLSRRVIRELRLPRIGSAKDVDTDGRVRGMYQVFQADEVAAFGQLWQNQEVHELETDQFDGLIGPRFLLGRRFTLDYPNRLLGISSVPLPAEVKGHEALPLFPVRGLEGMLVVRGSVNGRSVFIQVDTGKSRTCVASSLAAALALPKAPGGYQIDQVQLGTFVFRVPSARQEPSFEGISEGLAEPILLGIGSDILSQAVFTVDYLGRRLLIRK